MQCEVISMCEDMLETRNPDAEGGAVPERERDAVHVSTCVGGVGGGIPANKKGSAAAAALGMDQSA